MARPIDNQSFFASSRDKIGRFFGRLFGASSSGSRKVVGFTGRHPFLALLTGLGILLLLIVLGNTVFKAKPAEEAKPNPIKEVRTLTIGSAPKVAAQAKVEKSGVVQIVAQAPGIVNSINVLEGDLVDKGQILINLASNYQGGNAASLSRQIAENQVNLAKQTFDTQKEIIDRNRQVAEKTDQNQDQLRDIQNRSLDESRALLDLNESLIETLESTLPTDASPTATLQTRSAIAQAQAGVIQLRSSIRNLEFQSASDRPPAELSNLQREITLKQLDVQEKTLEMNTHIAKLQYQLAAVNEATMYPASPYNATVERVHVRFGQAVNPGTVLVTLAAPEGKIKLDTQVPASVSKNISSIEESQITINGKTISMRPAYVSSEATQGQLYSVIFQLDDTYTSLFTDGSYVSVALPVGAAGTNSAIPFVPIDSVFQTQDEAYVFTIENNRAKAKTISLGNVQGRFVAVEEGLGNNDQVILDRFVVDGDEVKAIQP